MWRSEEICKARACLNTNVITLVAFGLKNVQSECLEAKIYFRKLFVHWRRDKGYYKEGGIREERRTWM
jgi:hypothetical protein